MRLLNYDEAAELLAVKRSTLYAWVSQKRVPFVRYSPRCVRFEREALLLWIEERRVAPTDRLHRRKTGSGGPRS
jgi:excisionase family DNA binding protein